MKLFRKAEDTLFLSNIYECKVTTSTVCRECSGFIYQSILFCVGAALEVRSDLSFDFISDLSFGSADPLRWMHTGFFSEDSKPESPLQVHTRFALQQN